MKKVTKILLGLIGVILLLVIIAVTVVVLNLDRIVKKSVERYGPQITKVDVKLDAVHIGLMSGSASIKGLVVGNPPGYKAPHAISVGEASVGIVPSSILADKIIIRSIRVDAPEVTFEGSLSENNLTTIKNNTSQKNTSTVTNEVGQAKPEKKLEVDEFVISGAKVDGTLVLLGNRQVAVHGLTIPDIRLKDLGKGPEGITPTDLTKRVVDELTRATLAEIGRMAAGVGKNVMSGQTTNLNQLKESIGNLLHKPKTETTNSP